MPVVLSYVPRWQPADWIAPHKRQPLQPSYFAPLASEDFQPYEPLPELELDLSPAQGEGGKTTVGGWIEVGYHGGRLGQ